MLNLSTENGLPIVALYEIDASPGLLYRAYAGSIGDCAFGDGVANLD
ncbi:hypothetical protein [Aporhodopirellula aestuarii]|uniref:Uncharacterized protein n=1 Tax=Aporhodopirellula aestuarii TaxID=2950107 RepID=A0ABT0UDQ0_9BACT|nr:hypothetical protein [Aporhodopirellula aestuarii]MCM2375045.1 hypothetical protein [Aporhodopirellula aestuarii]